MFSPGNWLKRDITERKEKLWKLNSAKSNF